MTTVHIYTWRMGEELDRYLVLEKKKELSQKIICTLVFADLRTSNPMHAVKIYR